MVNVLKMKPVWIDFMQGRNGAKVFWNSLKMGKANVQ
jgi:hypothetical protein